MWKLAIFYKINSEFSDKNYMYICILRILNNSRSLRYILIKATLDLKYEDMNRVPVCFDVTANGLQ